jgi:broad specificity phosphatase PhoE
MIRIFVMLVFMSIGVASCSHKYYIVRHAEKELVTDSANMMSNDPSLSEAGKVRALALRDQLKNRHVKYIYSTNTKRTISTVTPLSQASGVKIQLYNTKDSLTEFIRQLQAVKKGNVLIVGHSNTVDDIVNQLCNAIRVPGDLSDSQYDNIFIVTCKGNKISFERSKYGYPSNPE